MRRAFTLIELLVVVAIIGLISSAALVFVRETADVKALAYTKRVMASVKAGIAETDEDGYFTGFVNDYGTLPPHPAFLTGTDADGNFTYVGGRAAHHRFASMTEQDGTAFPAPFMDQNPSTGVFRDTLGGADETVSSVLYAGYRGGYLADGEAALNDGWNTPIRLQSDLNISSDHADSPGGANLLRLRSAGADRRFDDGDLPLVRKAFDLSQEEGSIEGLYADDYNLTYDKRRFAVHSLTLDLTLSREAGGSDVNETALLIYAPMLYYAEGADNTVCTEHNTTHAECASAYRAYRPFAVHDDAYAGDLADRNLSWHVGLIKYQLYFADDNNSRLFINRGGILAADGTGEAYDFNQSNAAADLNLTASAFFDDVKIRYADANGTVRQKPPRVQCAMVADSNRAAEAFGLRFGPGRRRQSLLYVRRDQSAFGLVPEK